MIKFCTKCLWVDGSGNANYCRLCPGSKLEQLKRCECGAELLPVDKKVQRCCINCGKEIPDELYF